MAAIIVAAAAASFNAAVVPEPLRCSSGGEWGRGTASCLTRVKSVSMRAIINKEELWWGSVAVLEEEVSIPGFNDCVMKIRSISK